MARFAARSKCSYNSLYQHIVVLKVLKNPCGPGGSVAVAGVACSNSRAVTCLLFDTSKAANSKMRVRSLLRPVLSRCYSSRLPERPPYRAPDPLTNDPNVVHQTLPNDLTFIHRPPPTAPTPFSYTTAPASPLLKKDASSAGNPLPPTLRTEKPQPERLSDEQVARLRKLRAEDPVKWTRGRLAKEFGCTQSFVMHVAALKSSDRKKALTLREAEHEKARSTWGEKRSLVREIRKKRREFW